MRTVYYIISNVASWLFDTLELYEEPGADSPLGEVLDVLARISLHFHVKATLV